MRAQSSLRWYNVINRSKAKDIILEVDIYGMV